MEAWGDRVRRLRRRKGWTQEELADRTGIGRRYIGSIETGDVENPEPATVKKLAKAFGVSMRSIGEPLKWWDDEGRPNTVEAIELDPYLDDDGREFLRAAYERARKAG